MKKIIFAVIILLIGGMIMSYTRVNWQNAPSTATPINAENLNKMDKGIDDIDEALDALESSIVGQFVNDATKINNAAATYDIHQRVNTINNNLDDINSQLASTTQQINDLDANKAEKTDVNAINLRVDNLVIPISPENVNVEVTDAHNSIVKNKNFLSLKDRLEESENDLIQHKLDYVEYKTEVDNLVSVKNVINDFSNKTLDLFNPFGTTRIFKIIADNTQILTKTIINCESAGTVKIKILKNINGVFDFVKDIPVQVVSGLNNIELYEPLDDNYVIGFYSDSVRLRSSSEIGEPFYYFTGDATGSSMTPNGSEVWATLGISFELTSKQNNIGGLNQLDTNIRQIGVVMEGNPSSFGSTRILDYKFSRGMLTKLKVYAKTVGTLNIKIFSKTGDLTFLYINEIAVSIPKIGLNIIKPNILIPQNCYIGLYSNDVNLVASEVGTSIGYFVKTTNVTSEATFTKNITSNLAVSLQVIESESLWLQSEESVLAKNIGFVADGGAMSVSLTRLLNHKIMSPSILKTISIFAKTTGTLKIKVFSSLDDSNFTFVKEITVPITQVGLNKLNCNLELSRNSYIGLYSDDVQFTFNNSSQGERYWTAPSNVYDTEVFKISETNYRINVLAEIEEYVSLKHSNTESLEAQITALKKITHRNNNIKPLYLETFDKTNQPLHPSVIHISAGFGGYKYWMVESPLPNGATYNPSRYECPHIHCSHDGIHWETPKGLINPIDDLTPEEEVSNETFMSDPHLVYKDGVLEAWYRISGEGAGDYPDFEGTPTLLLRKTSSDGVNWSERKVMNDFQDPNSGLYDMARSPAIIWDGTKYKMWFVDKVAPIKPRNVVYAESLDGETWTNRTNCTLHGRTDDNWHIDVHFSNGEYHLIIHSQDRHALNYYTSADGINFTFKGELLKTTTVHRSNFNSRLYRSCLVWNGSNYLFYVTGEKRLGNEVKWSISLAVGKTINSLEWIDGNYFREKQFFEKGIRLTNNEEMISDLEIAENGDAIGYDWDNQKPIFKKRGLTQFLGTFVEVPKSPTASGVLGDFSADENNLYVCYAPNSWIKIAKSDW